MRPGMLLTLVGSWLVLTVMTQPLPAKPSRPPTPNGKVAVVDQSKIAVLKVEGRWQSTAQDAWLSAENQAQVALVDHFRQQGLSLERKPTSQELRPVLARSWKYAQEDKQFDDVGLMHRIVLDIPVTPEVESFLVKQDRMQRAHERMIGLAKILAVLVVMLGGVAGYLYLDEWSKGYAGWYFAGPVLAVMILLVIACLAL